MENPYNLSDEHIFTYDEIIRLLNECMNKTLGEVDKNHVFDRTITNKKITGIAGDVVEQSILGYLPDSDQRPDILVDGIPTEVKTTGIRYSKKPGCEKKYEAKEPMSITAVSPNSIVNEEFETSHFWKKLAHLLLVYYLYDSSVTVDASQYADFYLKSFEFHTFSQEDKIRLQNDWEAVRNFIKDIQENSSNPEVEYPRLSHELRDSLMYIDTAPKWPNPPRFRLKRSFVTSIVQDHFDNDLEKLPDSFFSFLDIDRKLHSITEKYKGKTVLELLNEFDIHYDDENKLNKAISEQIIIKMFGGKSNKINKIELFEKVGMIAKSICISSKGTRTEDMKLFAIDFDEWTELDKQFEDSFISDYFTNHQLLCIIFEEKDEKKNFKDNIFTGFKRISFESEFIDDEVFGLWCEIRDLVINQKLSEEVKCTKKGLPVINKNGEISTSINFPKSNNHTVFVRGSGKDSSCKPLLVNNIRMYNQWIWIKGKYIVDLLKEKEYI